MLSASTALWGLDLPGLGLESPLVRPGWLIVLTLNCETVVGPHANVLQEANKITSAVSLCHGLGPRWRVIGEWESCGCVCVCKRGVSLVSRMICGFNGAWVPHGIENDNI